MENLGSPQFAQHLLNLAHTAFSEHRVTIVGIFLKLHVPLFLETEQVSSSEPAEQGDTLG